MKARAPAPGRLDHDLYDHRSAACSGTRFWQAGHRAAAFVLLHVESVELDPPTGTIRDPRLRSDLGNYFPDYRGHSLIEYGNRIGVFRLLDHLQSLGWKVAAAVNGLVAQEKPELVRELMRRDVAILAGGWSASRLVSSATPEADERALLQRTIDAITGATGIRPSGYASQDYGYSLRTPALLVETGFAYAVDWPNDDRPFDFGPERRLVMIPVAAELDDAHAMIARKLRPELWTLMLDRALAFWREEATPGAVLVLSLHPWVAGAAHRFASLRRALASHPAADFWQVHPAEIAAAWQSSGPVR